MAAPVKASSAYHPCPEESPAAHDGKHRTLERPANSKKNDDAKICVVMVGLPARGKSLIAGKGKVVFVTAMFTRVNNRAYSATLSLMDRYSSKDLQRRAVSPTRYSSAHSGVLRHI